MVQGGGRGGRRGGSNSEGSDSGEARRDTPLRFRDRHRLARHREFLDAARRIMTTEGRAALTMQRVTDAVGSSTGGIYVYFPSKDALIAELQHEAIEMLHRSYVRGQELLTELLDERGVDPAGATLTRVVASGQFWVDAIAAHPSEVALARNFLTPNGTDDTMAGAEAERVLPAVLALVDEVGQRCSEAVAHGALAPGNDTERALVMLSSVMVVLLTSRLGWLDQELFDGKRLASRLVHDLAHGWGADPGQLEQASTHLAAFAEHGTLAPPADED